MMNMNKCLGVISAGIVAASVAAQVAPLCCAYLSEWPPDEQDFAGACAGEFSMICEDSSFTSNGNNPLAMLQKYPSRKANCYRYDLGDLQYFIRGDCSVPPEPGTVRIGELPNGTCCWIGGSGTVDPLVIPQEYHVMNCDVDCPDIVA